jgi:hypothetical protein
MFKEFKAFVFVPIPKIALRCGSAVFEELGFRRDSNFSVAHLAV